MGKQMNFYMLKSDEDEFISYIQSDREVCIFLDRIKHPYIEGLKSLPDRDVPGWFMVYLWDKTNSPPPKIDYVPEQKHYVVDFFESEVIQFSRSYFDKNRLVRGRIWAEMKKLQSGDLSIMTKKSESFEKWFNKLSNWIKKKSKKNDFGDYLLAGAAKFVLENGKIVQTP
jgi:hypothetical protein